MERLGYGALWYGEAIAREVFAQGAIYLSASSRLVVASGIANLYARDPQAMAAGVVSPMKAFVKYHLAASADRNWRSFPATRQSRGA
jgi:hypothetical protein